jgi:hypothetical protein
MRAPETREEWIEALRLATISLLFHRAAKRGFLSGVVIDVALCEWTIAEARRRHGLICQLEVEGVIGNTGRA